MISLDSVLLVHGYLQRARAEWDNKLHLLYNAYLNHEDAKIFDKIADVHDTGFIPGSEPYGRWCSTGWRKVVVAKNSSGSHHDDKKKVRPAAISDEIYLAICFNYWMSQLF